MASVDAGGAGASSDIRFVRLAEMAAVYRAIFSGVDGSGEVADVAVDIVGVDGGEVVEK